MAIFSCVSFQKSLEWCQGRPEYSGMRRRIYYIEKRLITAWPHIASEDDGYRPGSATYTGQFTLRADATWKYIDILPEKSQLTSEPQGEYPSQTQLNKLVAVLPGTRSEYAAAAAYLNNTDNVFIVEDMLGCRRVVGSEKWLTKTTVSQDIGQGVTGTPSTTITVEATDIVPAPFYTGEIVTEDGTLSGVLETG